VSKKWLEFVRKDHFTEAYHRDLEVSLETT